MQLALQIKDGEGWKTLNVRNCADERPEVTKILMMAQLAKEMKGWDCSRVFPASEYRIVRQF